jgi:hypothetical protein
LLASRNLLKQINQCPIGLSVLGSETGNGVAEIG